MADLSSWYKGVLVVTGLNRGFTESYYMRKNTWDLVKADFKYIAEWRASILARNLQVKYATVVRVGSERKSDLVIAKPLNGSRGVKFPTSAWASVLSLNCNSPATGLMYRFQTVTRQHISSYFRGLPDGVFNNFMYLSPDGNGDQAPVPSGTDSALNTDLPYDAIWNYATPPDPDTDYTTWENAVKKFLIGVRDFTIWARFKKDTTISSTTNTDPSGDTDGVSEYSGLGKFTWNTLNAVEYRRVTDVAPGRPSLV